MKYKVYDGIDGFFQAMSDLTTTPEYKMVDPERYDIIEKESYKKKRIEKEIKDLESVKDYYNKERKKLVDKVDKVDESIIKLKDELKDIGS